MYYVEQKYHDTGEVEVRVLLESEVIGSTSDEGRYAKATPQNAYYEEGTDFDLYVDCFESRDEADDFAKKAASTALPPAE